MMMTTSAPDVVDSDDCAAVLLQIPPPKSMMKTGIIPAQQKDESNQEWKPSAAIYIACPLKAQPSTLSCSVNLLQTGHLPRLWSHGYALHYLFQCEHWRPLLMETAALQEYTVSVSKKLYDSPLLLVNTQVDLPPPHLESGGEVGGCPGRLLGQVWKCPLKSVEYIPDFMQSSNL